MKLQTNINGHENSIPARLTRLFIVVAYLMTSVLMTSGPAMAASKRVAGTPHANTYMGIEQLGSERFVCIGNGRALPTKFGARKTATDAELAYLIRKHGKSTNKSVATALAYIMKTDSKHTNHKNSTPKLEQSRVASMRADAKKHAGPYNANQIYFDQQASRAVIKGVGVRSKAGNYVAGATVTMTISGPGVFANSAATNSGKKLVVTSATAAKSYTITRTGSLTAASTISVGVKVTGLAGTTYQWTEAQASGYQRTLSMNPSSSTVSRSVSTSWVSTASPLEYSISTVREVSEIGVDGQRQSRDLISLEAVNGTWPAGQSVVVNSTLYHHGPDKPELSMTVPATSTPVAHVTTTFTGPGRVFTPWVDVPAGFDNDYFVWHETVAGSGSGSSAIHSWNGMYGVEEETFDYRPRDPMWSVLVETRTSELDPASGDIHDEFDVTLAEDPGFANEWGEYEDSETGEKHPVGVVVTFDLYHSENDPTIAPQSAPPATATLVATVKSDPVTSEGTGYVTPTVKVPEEYRSGYLTWVASIDPADIVGEVEAGMLFNWRSAYGIAAETTFTPWTPHIVTSVAEKVINSGDEMVDWLTVTGLPGDGVTSPVMATCTAWGPFAEAPKVGSILDPETAPFAGEGTSVVTSNGQYECNAGLAPSGGHYVFTESTSANTDGTVNPTRDLEVYAEESFITRWDPTVITRVQSQYVRPGDEVIDIISVTGIPESTSPVTATCTLWGPFAAHPEIGDEVDALANDPAATGTVEVTGDGEYECSAGRISESGIYVFTHETSESEDGLIRETSDLTIYAEETQVVQWIPEVVTKAARNLIKTGDHMIDELTVTGLPEGKSITATCTAWGPFAEKPEVGSTIDPDTAPLAGEGSIEVTPNGTFDCNAGVAQKPGFYVFTESSNASADNQVGDQADLNVYSEESFTVEGPPASPPLIRSGRSLFWFIYVIGGLVFVVGGLLITRVTRAPLE